MYETADRRISSLVVADVNNDGEKELVLIYMAPYDKKLKEQDYYFKKEKNTTAEIFLGVYAFKSGSLIELNKTRIEEISDICITNIIPEYKNGIFIRAKYRNEYPFYEMYSMKYNKLFKID